VRCIPTTWAGWPPRRTGRSAPALLGTAWDSTQAHEALPEDITDVTRPHPLRAGQAAAGRAARVQDLTGVLAEAVTAQDVVAAVADHVLPPFGASGLLVEVAQAWAFLPLVVSGQAVGLCIISFEWPRRLLGAERALLTRSAA
jgi:hypothetical protein